MSQGPWRGTITETEKRIQQKIMTLLRLVGFRVWNLSQARATNQSPGLPDVFAMHPTLCVEVTIEVKTPKGRASEPQREFAELRRRCARPHLIGGMDVVEGWLIELGLMREVGGQRVLAPKRTSAPLHVDTVENGRVG